MHKKGLLMMAVMAVLAAGGAFALPEFKLSAGVGGYFTSDFGGGVKDLSSSDKLTYPYAGGGGFAFFDATYAEVALGFFAASGNVNITTSGSTFKDPMSYTGLDISLLGKYPFALGEHFTLFPLLGIDYRHMVAMKVDGTKRSRPGEYSALWFKFGAGADYAFTEHLFMRLGLTYGIRLANKWEKDTVALFAPSYKTALGHGLDVKLAAGWKF